MYLFICLMFIIITFTLEQLEVNKMRPLDNPLEKEKPSSTVTSNENEDIDVDGISDTDNGNSSVSRNTELEKKDFSSQTTICTKNSETQTKKVLQRDTGCQPENIEKRDYGVQIHKPRTKDCNSQTVWDNLAKHAETQTEEISKKIMIKKEVELIDLTIDQEIKNEQIDSSTTNSDCT